MIKANTEWTETEWTETEWTEFKQALKLMFEDGEWIVTFVKADGTIRVMRCTLDPQYLQAVQVIAEAAIKPKKERKVSPGTIAVFDVEKQAWRSITLKSITDIEIA